MRYIAIDTEYFCDPETATNYSPKVQWDRLKNTLFTKLHCIAATTSDGQTYKKWFRPDEAQEICLDFLQTLNIDIENDIFIVHAWELAEGNVLRYILKTCLRDYIDEDIIKEIFYNIKVIDTYLLARMCFRVYSELERDKVRCDYASLCMKLLNVSIDTTHKELMRKCCATDNTVGNEDAILDYCLSDTQYLIPLYKALRSEYIKLYNHGIPINFHAYRSLETEKYEEMQFDFNVWKDFVGKQLAIDETKAEEKILRVCHSASLYAYINGNGIPVDVDLVDRLKTNWLDITKSAAKYYGLTKYCKPKKDDVCLRQKDLKAAALQELKEKKVPFKWPLTKSGNLSTDKNDKIIFEETGATCTIDEFMDFYGDKWSDLLVVKFKKFDKEKRLIKYGANYFRHVDAENKIKFGCSNIYSAITGRAQGQPSAGHIPHAAHALHCLMKAPEGKILFEMDCTAAETYIAGAISHDGKLLEAYKQKDIYLYLATLINPNSKYHIPKEEYFSYVNSGRYNELKEKYSKQRKILKSTFLGVQYGLGVKSLASHLNISEDEAAELRGQFKVQYSEEVPYGTQIMFEIDRFQACIFQPVNKDAENISKTAQWFDANMADRKALVFKSGYLAKFDRTTSRATAVRNFPTQGGCAQILFDAIDRLFLNDKITIHCTVHDAIICSCDINYFDRAKDEITKAFQDAACNILNMPYNINIDDKFKMKCEWAITRDEHIETENFIYNKLHV